MSIPKRIHYCWYGHQKIPSLLKKCIESWEEYLPDYEFILWNETNSDFDCEYVKRAYEEKRWAFVSDYMRLKVIYEYGGFYLDTDMFLINDLDPFLKDSCFFVAEHSKSIGAGIFGAEADHNFIKLCLDRYREPFEKFIGIPYLLNRVFQANYKVFTGYSESIIFRDLKIYEPSYYYALPYKNLYDIHKFRDYLVSNSRGVHLWYGSWHSYSELVLFRRKEYLKGWKALKKKLRKRSNWRASYLFKVIRAFKDGLTTPNAFK